MYIVGALFLCVEEAEEGGRAWIRLRALGASGFLGCCLGSGRTAGFPEQ